MSFISLLSNFQHTRGIVSKRTTNSEANLRDLAPIRSKLQSNVAAVVSRCDTV